MKSDHLQRIVKFKIGEWIDRQRDIKFQVLTAPKTKQQV